MNDLNHLVVPHLNINGTSKHELMMQLEHAAHTLQTALKSLNEAAPHGRDYQTVTPALFTLARMQHYERYKKIKEVYNEILYIWNKLDCDDNRRVI